MITNNYFKYIPDARKVYEKGENIIHFLKGKQEIATNPIDTIQISYDLQSGSYVEYANRNKDYIEAFTEQIAQILNQFEFASILEAGVGEATTFVNVLKKLSKKPSIAKGFDLSLSRLFYAQAYASSLQVEDVEFFVANIEKIPVLDCSYDLVYTCHALEPNGGREKELLTELFRITNRYLVLFEPSYRDNSQLGQARMDKLGYIKDIDKHAQELGYKVIKHELCIITSNPLNPTAVTIIEKIPININKPIYVCPNSGLPLQMINNYYYNKDAGLLYTIVKNIPVLLPNNAILATHYATL
jgi:ubiquinone/menaquinone biosynthesis C-methylase UbiE/uncharacterized protein YbaR (Trm112 family)